MSNRKETERTKLLQEKCQTYLTQMLRDEDNKYCVDCDAKGPRWASWNIGVFLCIRCAGIHRNLGVHISRVKSVNLDSWTPEQVVSLQQMGNSRARAVYEAQLPDGFRRPQNDSALESFIRAKYEHKKYLAREWVPPAAPKVDWNKEIDEELERQKRKKKSSSSPSTLSMSSPAGDKKNAVSVKTPLPAPLPKPKTNSSSPKSSRIELNNTASSDLLGLSSPVSTTNTSSISQQSVQSVSDSNDVFSNFLSALPSTTVATIMSSDNTVKHETDSNLVDNLAKQEADFFNQSIPNEKEKAKLTKDSILALYSSPPANNFNNATMGGCNLYNTAAGYSQPLNTNNYMALNQQQYTNTLLGNQFGQQNLPMSGIPNALHQNPGFMNHNMTMGGNPQTANNTFNMLSQPQTQVVPNSTNFAVNFPPQTSTIQNSFAQFPQNNFSQPNPANSTSGNLNQQFGNMTLSNVWQ